MDTINVDELINLFESKNVNMDGFVIGKVLTKPGLEGCILVDQGWFLYSVDDWGNVIYTGPFSGKSIVYACAIRLHSSKLFPEYKFGEKELSILFHSHFRSLSEIQNRNA